MVMKMMYALPRLKENLTEVSIDDQLTLGDPPLNFSAPPSLPYVFKIWHKVKIVRCLHSNICNVPPPVQAGSPQLNFLYGIPRQMEYLKYLWKL